MGFSHGPEVIMEALRGGPHSWDHRVGFRVSCSSGFCMRSRRAWRRKVAESEVDNQWRIVEEEFGGLALFLRRPFPSHRSMTRVLRLHESSLQSALLCKTVGVPVSPGDPRGCSQELLVPQTQKKLLEVAQPVPQERIPKRIFELIVDKPASQAHDQIWEVVPCSRFVVGPAPRVGRGDGGGPDQLNTCRSLSSNWQRTVEHAGCRTLSNVSALHLCDQIVIRLWNSQLR